MHKPDVRLAVGIDEPVTGAQILDAVRNLDEQENAKLKYHYFELRKRKLNSAGEYKIGVKSGCLGDDIVIKTGDKMDKDVILGAVYPELYVASYSWGGPRLSDTCNDISVIKSVEKMRDCLEKLL